MKITRKAFFLSLLLVSGVSLAGDLIIVQRMTLELALDAAQASMKDCAEKGYPVSVVVVDRSATPMVVLRDLLANRFTSQIAEEKANAVILSGVRSGEFRENRKDILSEMNLLDGILVLQGGVPIRKSGALLGAIGVSGAPGGDLDEECALAGIAAVAERLEFAD